MSSPKPTNRLIHETSPYLLQHAHNPVDWYAWGPEAFAAAREQDRPILLSVGYSACHWCHVMERESFENVEIAQQMNADFISVKVDREERPEVDSIYMSAVQRLTGQGGWPMTVFLTPEGKPFFGGTYFPPDDLYGRPGFPRILTAVATAWVQQRSEIDQQSVELTADLIEGDNLLGGLSDTLLTPALLDSAYKTLAGQFDPISSEDGASFTHVFASSGQYLLVVDGRAGEGGPFQLTTFLHGPTTGVDDGAPFSPVGAIRLLASPNPARSGLRLVLVDFT